MLAHGVYCMQIPSYNWSWRLFNDPSLKWFSLSSFEWINDRQEVLGLIETQKRKIKKNIPMHFTSFSNVSVASNEFPSLSAGGSVMSYELIDNTSVKFVQQMHIVTLSGELGKKNKCGGFYNGSSPARSNVNVKVFYFHLHSLEITFVQFKVTIEIDWSTNRYAAF